MRIAYFVLGLFMGFVVMSYVRAVNFKQLEDEYIEVATALELKGFNDGWVAGKRQTEMKLYDEWAQCQDEVQVLRKAFNGKSR